MKKHLLLACILSFTLFSCSQTAEQNISVIPRPAEQEMTAGSFEITRNTQIVTDLSNSELERLAENLSQRISTATAWDIEIVNSGSQSTADSSIVLELAAGGDFASEEAYKLDVTPSGITIGAGSTHGMFYGIQTLRQLLPPEIEHKDYTLVPRDTEWTIPAVTIQDQPRFTYRGLHLDAGRHFMPVDFIKKYIDLMAFYKMNRFHWHLTEDQGWRIEIKKYPRLTEVGAWRDSTLVGHYGTGRYDGKRYGGFYTQEEIREVVSYAQNRYVTIVPEIEMPGHSSAALAAYPELGCVEEKEYRVKTTWGVFEDIYCPKEETFQFLENVLTEVMDLFPGEYIHIGGDEAPKTQWENSAIAQKVIQRENLEDEHELQSYFIQRIESFLNDHGRQIIGWDEILEGGLAPNAAVMSWRGTEGGIEAARQQHNVVMTPNSHCYLDYYQADPDTEPLAIGGFTTLEKTYSYEPVPGELDEEEAKYILGAQGNVWTEYMHTPDKVEYMAYPRAMALSEVTWSAKERREWTNFWNRLQNHFNRLELLDVNFADHYRGRIPKMENPG